MGSWHAWRRGIALCLVVAAFWASTRVARAEGFGDLLGLHPDHSHGHPDPYLAAESREGKNCCHSADCVEFLGEPERVAGGWQFGPWFVAEEKAIKPETLARSVRGIYSICFAGGRVAALAYGAKAHVRCGHAPQSGT